MLADVAERGYRPLCYGDMVCLHSQISQAPKGEALESLANKSSDTGYLTADGLTSMRCSFRLEFDTFAREEQAEEAKDADKLPRDVYEGVFEIMPPFRHIAAKELHRMEKAAAGVDSAGVDAEEEDENDDGSGHKHDGRVVVYVEFSKTSTLYENEWAASINEAEDQKKRGEYIKEYLKEVHGDEYDHSQYRFDIQKKSAVNDGKGKKRVVFCISKKPRYRDDHSNSSTNISMPLIEARHIAKCMASWKVLHKANSQEMYFTARDRDKACVLFEELLKRQKSKDRVKLGTVGRQVLEQYWDQVPTKRFKDTHRQESAEGPDNRWSICQEEFLEAYCAVRFVEQAKDAKQEAKNREEQLNRLRERVALERNRNEKLYKDMFGEKLKYGHQLCLRHLRSGKFVDVHRKKYSSETLSGRLVSLDPSPHGKPSSIFQVEPCLKYFSHGEPVTDSSPIMLENVSMADFFLEASNAAIAANKRYREVTCARRSSSDATALAHVSWFVKLFGNGEASPYRSQNLTTGALVRIGNPATASFMVAARHAEIISHNYDEHDSDEESEEGEDEETDGKSLAQTSATGSARSITKMTAIVRAQKLAKYSSWLHKARAGPPAGVREEARISRYVFTVEKNRTKFNVGLQNLEVQGIAKLTLDSVWVLESPSGPDCCEPLSIMRQEEDDQYPKYRLRNFHTSQYLAVVALDKSAQNTLTSTVRSQRGFAQGSSLPYQLEMVDLKRVRKSEMLQHYGFLWTLTPVKNKVGTDDSAPDHFSFRVGMDAPTQPKPRRHSSSGSEDGLSGDEDERSRIDSDGMSSEGDIRTGELVLASIPETGGLIVEVKEKEQQFHQSQDCFTVDKVPVAYQRKVRAVSKLVTGLEYFVKKAMSSFLKKHLHDAWMVGTGGKEAKYTEAFMQLSQEEQRINARDRRFYKDEFNNLKKFQKLLLETKMIHRHQDIAMIEEAGTAKEAKEAELEGEVDDLRTMGRVASAGLGHGQDEELYIPKSDLEKALDDELLRSQDPTGASFQDAHREREIGLTKLSEEVRFTCTPTEQRYNRFCNHEDDTCFEASEWEKAKEHSLSQVFPASADKERQNLLRQAGVVDELYRVLAVASAKFEEVKDRGDENGKHKENKDLKSRLEAICRLVFKFARHFAFDSREHELLLADANWIDDLIVMQLGSQLGEEECFTDIVSNNKTLLAQHISQKTVSHCVEIIKIVKVFFEQEKGLASGNFLKFLRAISSCEGMPISSNQNSVLQMVYSLLDKKRMSRGADLIRGNVLMQTRVRRILGSNDQKPQWVPLLASRTQQMKSGPTLNGKKADVEVMESGPALGGKEANEGSMNQSQNASEYVGNWLVDENGCIRDSLIEVSWSSFPFVSGAGVDLESKYKAEHLFQFEHTTELLLLKGRLTAAAFTKHLDDASRISIELFDGEDDTYDWYEYFKNAIVFDFRKHSYTFSFYPEIGGITTCVTAEILEGQSVDASKMNTRQSSEAGSRNALRSVKLQLFFSSSLRDAVETLALKQGKRNDSGHMDFTISRNYQVTSPDQREDLLTFVQQYNEKLTREFGKSQHRGKKRRPQCWGPFVERKDHKLIDLTLNREGKHDPRLGIRCWVPLSVLSRYLADPTYSNMRTHEMIQKTESSGVDSASDSAQHHLRLWYGWLGDDDQNEGSINSKRLGTASDAESENLIDEARSQVAEFYHQQINLLAELCIGRNNRGINAIRCQYSFDMLLAALKDETRRKSQHEHFKQAAKDYDRSVGVKPLGIDTNQCRLGLPSIYRAAFTNLLKILFIDVSPQAPTMVPSYTRSFSNAVKVHMHNSIAHSNESHLAHHSIRTTKKLDLSCPPRVDKFFLVEQILEDYLQKQKGMQDPFDPPGTLLSMQVLDLLHTMVKFGLYQNKDKVTKLVDPLVDLLNGAMDREEVPEDRSGLGVGSVAIPAALLRGSSGRRINRYKKVSSPSVDTALVIESKKLVLRILRLLSNAQLDLEVNIFFSKLEDQWRKRHISLPQNYSSSKVHPAGGSDFFMNFLEDVKKELWRCRPGSMDGLDLDGVVEENDPGMMNEILLDLIQYDDTDLCEAVLSIVMSRSKRTTELCAAIRMTELLDSNLEPKALRTYVGAAEAENLHDSHLSKRLQQHFHKNGLKSLDLKRMGLEDTRTEAEKTVDQIKAVITDIMSGMETFESDVQGPSEEFVLGHVQLLWSMIRHRDPMTPHYPDVFKDIFRDAGIFTVFEQLMYVNIKVNEQKILDSLERQQRKQNFLTAALQLMELVVQDHEINRRASIPLIPSVIKFIRRAIKVLYPEGKHGTTPKKADQARGIESKDSPDKNYPNQDRIDGFGESPSQKTIKLKPLPAASAVSDNFMKGQKTFLLDVLNRLACILFRIVRGSTLVCMRHVGETEISQVLDFAEKILSEALYRGNAGDRGDSLSVVTKLLDILVEWPAPTPYCQRSVPIPRNQSYMLHELLSRSVLHDFLMELSRHAEVVKKKVKSPRGNGRRKSSMLKEVGGSGGSLGDKLAKTEQLPVEPLFAIVPSDFEDEDRNQTQMEDNFWRWTVRLRTKLISVLQATCLGTSGAAEAQCQKLWKLDEICAIVTMGTSLDQKDRDSVDTGMHGVSFFGPGDKVWNEIGAKRTAVQYLNTVFIDTEVKVPDADSYGQVDIALEVLESMCDSLIKVYWGDEMNAGKSPPEVIPPDAIPAEKETDSHKLLDRWNRWCDEKCTKHGGVLNQVLARQAELGSVDVAAKFETAERICFTDFPNSGRREGLYLSVGKWAVWRFFGRSGRSEVKKGVTGESQPKLQALEMLQRLEFVCKAALPLLLNFFAAYPKWTKSGLNMQGRVLYIVEQIMSVRGKLTPLDRSIRILFPRCGEISLKPKYRKEYTRIKEVIFEKPLQERKAYKEDIVGIFKRVSRDYNDFMWPTDIDSWRKHGTLPPIVARNYREIEQDQIQGEFDEIVLFMKDPNVCVQALRKEKDAGGERCEHNHSSLFRESLYGNAEGRRTNRRFQRAVKKITLSKENVAPPRKIVITSSAIVNELMAFVTDRLKHFDEAHADMIEFVVKICERMVSLDIDNIIKCQRAADEDDRIDSNEQKLMLDAERKLHYNQISIAEQHAPMVIHDIICRQGLDTLHPITLSFGAVLLERGNLDVQRLFLGVMANQETFIQAMRDLIHKAVDAARSELTSIKRKCTRKTAATLEDPNEMFEKLLRFVQLLCEGHFTEMQELLNQQPASNSINLWGEIAKYLNLFKDTTRLCRMNARVMRQLLDTLTEGMQGPCQQTQKILLESNLHEFCGRLLCIREEDYSCSCYLHAFRWRNNCDGLLVEEADGDEKDTFDSTKGPRIWLGHSKALDLVSVQKSAVQALMAMLEGCADRNEYARVLDGLDVSTLISQLGEGIKIAKDEITEVETNEKSARKKIDDGADAKKELSFAHVRKLEQNARVDVTQDVYTLLTSIDHFKPFLVAQLGRSIHEGLESGEVMKHYAPSTGSIEILRNQNVEKVVFRFHADWKPDQMEKMVKLRTIVESILMQTRDGNPQERYPELVDAATAIHFELQHERTVDKLRLGSGFGGAQGLDLGFFLQFAHIRRDSIMSYSFNIAVFLNLLNLFMYKYPDRSVEDQSTVQRWSTSGISPIGDLMTVEGPAGDFQSLAMVLALVLVPLYVLAISEHIFYVLPVNMNRRYLMLEITPPFSFLEGQVDHWRKKKSVESTFHSVDVSSRPKQQEDVDGDEDQDIDYNHSKRKGLRERIVELIDDDSGSLNVSIIVLMLVQVIMSFLDDMAFKVTDPASGLRYTPKEQMGFNQAADVIEWIAVIVFIIDLAVRLALKRLKFFTRIEFIGGKSVKEIDMFNLFDFVVVTVWASLFFIQKYEQAQLDASSVDEELMLLQGQGEDLTNVVMWLRLLRCMKVVALLSRVTRAIFNPPRILNSEVRRDSTGLIFIWFVISDLRLIVLLIYLLASILGCTSMIMTMTSVGAKGHRSFTWVLSPFWYCVCLFEMVRILSTLPNVFKAITMRSQQLAQTFLLGIYVWYIFGLFAFVFFPAAMTEKQPESCGTLAMCFIVAFEWGLRTGDVGEAMVELTQDDPRRYLQFMYTVLYFLLVSTILLNVIFGIIVDAFGELRDSQDALKMQILNECFICQHSRQKFEDPKVKTSFHTHIKEQHNIWHYIAFIIAISLKPKTELTGTEQYVIDELKNNRMDWFPALRSLELESYGDEHSDGEDAPDRE